MKKNYCHPSTVLLPMQCESLICASTFDQECLDLDDLIVDDYEFDFELII